MWSPLADNEFALVYFPDIGMTKFSICLANLRVAPIQVAGVGHSVSTFGADIDYYMSGADVETPDRPERFFSERLVLLPGCGSVNELPTYARWQGEIRSGVRPQLSLECAEG